MTNAQKHAGPATVRVRIAYQGDRLVATVEDDGCGTPVLGQGPGTGHGIMGMRERAAALRGTLEAGPSPGGGFRVRLALPLPVRAEARGMY
jgi:signal transduction histidine kinase